MKKILFVSIILFSQISHSNALKDFHNKGCELTGSYSKWYIVSKLGEGKYDVSINQGPYHKPKKAIINLESLQFSKKGEIGPFIFLKKASIEKMKTKDGFDATVTIYDESLECKEIYLRKIQYIQGSYPKAPKLEQEIWKEDQERAKKKREEVKKKKIQKNAKKTSVTKKKRAKEKKRSNKRESLYE